MPSPPWPPPPVIALLLQKFQALLQQQFHAQAVFSISSPDIIASAAPALAAVSNAVRALLTDAALLGLLTLLAWQLTKTVDALRRRPPRPLRHDPERSPHARRVPPEYTISLAMAAAGLAFCWFFARRNYLAYALVFWLVALRTPMLQLLDTANAALLDARLPARRDHGSPPSSGPSPPPSSGAPLVPLFRNRI